MRRQSKAHWRWKKRAAGPAWVSFRFPSLPEVGASATVAGGWRDMAGNQSSFIAGGEHSCGGRTSYLNVVLYTATSPRAEGSLAYKLHGAGVSRTATLDWEQRIAISLAVARGVSFIHSVGPSSCHGNIKSSNVLLSSTHDACVSEHGLITLGVDKLVSQEADVYSFGVLLLEILTRKTPVKSTRHEEGVDLPEWARSVIHEAREEWSAEVFDVELRRLWQNDRKKQHMIRLLQLALKCCSEDTNSRPTMSDVVQRIEEIR
ncbi:probable inactive receptor kinase At5g58300 [Lolium rigidum]|uniref:probable inactive receptor kinase At5g58300 n=1 Tax=Lolium rigidum TaxID=89674 RepID=UPI001F5C3364|nr:probable inactive receptor kinase At5g58300 [Lolium rigidum]